MSRVLPPTSTAGDIASVTAGLTKPIAESNTASHQMIAPEGSALSDIMSDYTAVTAPTQPVQEKVTTLEGLHQMVESEKPTEVISQDFNPAAYLKESQAEQPKQTGAMLAGAALSQILGK
jgi:hypothetical protein